MADHQRSIRWPVWLIAGSTLPISAVLAVWTEPGLAARNLQFNGFSYLPIGVTCLLVLLGAGRQVALGAGGRLASLAPRPREILVLTAAGLAAAALLGRGVGGMWHRALLFRESLGRKKELAASKEAFPEDLSLPDESALTVGLQQRDQDLALLYQAGQDGVAPIGEAVGPLAWLVLVLVLGLGAIIGLVLCVRRQWTVVERLQHPLAIVPRELAFGQVWQHTGFRVAVAGLLLVWTYQLGAAMAWHPLPKLPLGFEPLITFKGLHELLGMGVPGSGRWLYENYFSALHVFPIVIALAFLLVVDVGFSVWAFFVGGCLICGWLYSLGVPVDFYGSFRKGGGSGGALLAFALVIVYLGRHHFLGLLLAALGRRHRAGDDRAGVWGCRLLLISCLLLALLLWSWGGSLLAACAFILLFLAMLLVLARVVAESGLAFFESASRFSEIAVGLGLPLAVPAGGLVLLYWFGQVLITDTRTHMVGYLVQADAVASQAVDEADDRPVASRPPSKRRWLLLGFAFLCIIGTFGVLAGGDIVNLWTGEPAAAPEPGKGLLAWVKRSDGRDRQAVLFGLFDGRQTSMLVGFVLVLLVLGLRRVWTRCPLHPIGVVVAGAWPVIVTWGSLMLGWLIKVLVLRYGGIAVYQGLKPVAYGVVVGECLGYAAYMLLTLLVGEADAPALRSWP